MSKIKFERNEAGVGQILKSPEVTDVLIQYANQVKNRAGEGYSVRTGPYRVRVSVETQEAEQDNYENNTLLKSIKG